jgi:hypothetical protein
LLEAGHNYADNRQAEFWLGKVDHHDSPDAGLSDASQLPLDIVLKSVAIPSRNITKTSCRR